MSETQTGQKTVQNYRHDARNALTKAREALAFKAVTRTDETKEVYSLLNGAISSVLAGQQGFSQEQQVEHLSTALDKTTENRAKSEEALTAAKESLKTALTEALEGLDGWADEILAGADSAIATLTEAKEFAATRDFDQWQKDKNRRRGYSDDSEPESVSVDDLEEDNEE